MTQEFLLRIGSLPGYTPAVGRLVGMLKYARATTIAAVDGMTIAELDHLQDEQSNSIGTLLAHIAAVERTYQILTFEDRGLSDDENLQWSTALQMGDEGRRKLRGQPVEHYVEELKAVHQTTLVALAERDDEWLDSSVRLAPKINMHFAWFHVAEDELNHRGQIRWLRKRLPQRPK